jgi:L-2-hydroxycarboxylate dehydrogenase (NAD+)
MTHEPRTNGQWWEPTEDLIEVPIVGVEMVAITALRNAGASKESAELLLSSMLEKAAQGDPARGLGMLPNILRGAADGSATLRPEIEIRTETEATALVDGGRNANGAVVCYTAMELAMAKAEKAGVAWVSCTSSHWNLGPLLKMATGRGLIAMILNSSMPTVAPIGGTKPILGNAPTGVGIPSGDNNPIILDLSITNTSSSPVALAATVPGSSVPEGLILDERGEATTDPMDYLDQNNITMGSSYFRLRGSLTPLGGALSGHKGYGLLFAFNVLATALSDTDAPWVMAEGGKAQLGCQIVVVDPASFGKRATFLQRVDEFIETTRKSPKRSGSDEILYPGERSQRLQQRRYSLGTVMIARSNVTMLVALASEQGVDPTVLEVQTR